MCSKLISCCISSDYTNCSKNKIHLWFGKKEDIDRTEDGLISVFHLLGLISVFFYSFNSTASFMLFKCCYHIH